jgi:myo-inositol 2-dehydrogenase / D-chiro-inositol 1-dehydrogenase
VWANRNLEGVRTYESYGEMLRVENGLQAVVIAGVTTVSAALRSQTRDKPDPSGFFIEYAQSSSGIFVDCSIHDIDLALWFFGELYCVERQCGGITAVSPRRGNTMTGITRWASWSFGGKIAQLFCSRMMVAG